MRLVKTQSVVTAVEGLDEADTQGTAKARIRALVLVAPSGLGLLIEPRVLQVTKALPPTLVSNALAVEVAYREYQERALGREGLRSMYIGTLTLSLFLAVFAAILLAVVLGNQIARPLLLLTEGVNQVAAGDLTPKLALQGRDELGELLLRIGCVEGLQRGDVTVRAVGSGGVAHQVSDRAACTGHEPGFVGL